MLVIASNLEYEIFHIDISKTFGRQSSVSLTNWSKIKTLEAVSLKAFHSILDSKKLLPYIFIIDTTIHSNNETAVRMRKLFILLPFPAFHWWTTVSG